MPVPVIRALYVTALYGYCMTTSSFCCAIRPWPAATSYGDCAGVARGRRDLFIGGGDSVPWEEFLPRRMILVSTESKLVFQLLLDEDIIVQDLSPGSESDTLWACC